MVKKVADVPMAGEKNNLLMIPVDIQKAALLFMAADDALPTLSGLQVTVTAGHVVLAAMDGASLFQHEIPDYAGNADINLVVPGYICKLAVARAKKLKFEFVPLDVNTFFMGDIGFRPILDTVKPVPLDSLLNGDKDDTTTYDVDCLQRLQKASKLVNGGLFILPRLHHYQKCAYLELDSHTFCLAMATDIG